MEQKQKKTSGLVLAVSLFVAVFGIFFGILGILGKLPCPFAKKKAPIKRSFQRGEGELRRGAR